MKKLILFLFVAFGWSASAQLYRPYFDSTQFGFTAATGGSNIVVKSGASFTNVILKGTITGVTNFTFDANQFVANNVTNISIKSGSLQTNNIWKSGSTKIMEIYTTHPQVLFGDGVTEGDAGFPPMAFALNSGYGFNLAAGGYLQAIVNQTERARFDSIGVKVSGAGSVGSPAFSSATASSSGGYFPDASTYAISGGGVKYFVAGGTDGASMYNADGQAVVNAPNTAAPSGVSFGLGFRYRTVSPNSSVGAGGFDGSAVLNSTNSSGVIVTDQYSTITPVIKTLPDSLAGDSGSGLTYMFGVQTGAGVSVQAPDNDSNPLRFGPYTVTPSIATDGIGSIYPGAFLEMTYFGKGSAGARWLATRAVGKWLTSNGEFFYGDASTFMQNGLNTTHFNLTPTSYEKMHLTTNAYTAAPWLTMNTARLLGRTTASSGLAEEITVGSGLSLAAGTLTATGGGVALSAITAATGDNAIQNGAFNQLWRFTDPGTGEINLELTGTNSTASGLLYVRGQMTHATAVQTRFTESLASTGGSGAQDLVRIDTVASSTATPLALYSRGNRVIEVGYNANQLWAATGSDTAPTYSGVANKTGGMFIKSASEVQMQSDNANFTYYWAGGTVQTTVGGALSYGANSLGFFANVGGTTTTVLSTGDLTHAGIEYRTRVLTTSSGTLTLTTGVAGNTSTGSGSIHNITGTVTVAFPASPVIGDVYTVVVNTGNVVTLDPDGASQQLRIGASITTANTGTATATAQQGGSITFVYISTNLWIAIEFALTWVCT